MKTTALSRWPMAWTACWLLTTGQGVHAQPAPSVYYVCPGNVFTNTITPREAESRGCKSRETHEPTTFAAPRPRPAASARASDARVGAGEQRARDSDARRILEGELRKEQSALDDLKQQYNNGQPERQGNERNAQRYLDRVEQMKEAIARKESDIAAIHRELNKLTDASARPGTNP